MSASNFIQSTKFQINKVFFTVTSGKGAVKSTLFSSFTQFIKDVLIRDPAKGTFPNLFPFITHRGNSKTISYVEETDFSKVSKSRVIFSLGHNFPLDPGAVFPVLGRSFTETESIVHFIDNLVHVMNRTPKKLIFDLLPWNDLKSTISLLNAISTKRTEAKVAAQTHISIHSDFGVANVDQRPLTFGIYYGSSAGKVIADRLTTEYLNYARTVYPGKAFNAWVRHDSTSPHGRLGIIRDIKPVSLIFELDFVSRPAEDLNVVYDCVANSLISNTTLLDG